MIKISRQIFNYSSFPFNKKKEEKKDLNNYMSFKDILDKELSKNDNIKKLNYKKELKINDTRK